MRLGEAGRTEVYQITATRRAHSADLQGRTRRYLISMAVRTVCFVLAVAFDGWLRWVFLAGALLLPYLAVVIANAGREPNRETPDALLHDLAPPVRPALDGPARTGTSDAA